MGISLLSALSVPTVVAGNRGDVDQGERYSHPDSRSRGDSHYNKRHRHHHHRPDYRPYYPWGLGLGLATGWNVGYGANTDWNNDWGWNTNTG
ncbi:MAG: hypothetical protein ACRCWP_06475, partial [Shewanella sp.]